MKNNIVRIMSCSVCIFCIFATIATALENPIADQPSTLHWRENGQNKQAQLLIGDYYTTARTGWCESGHLTNDSNKYNHVHVTSSFDYTHEGKTITQSMVDAYWDNRYLGYDDEGGLDQTSNCYGYATGHDIWIDGISVILADEYIATNTTDAEIVDLSGHMKKITAYFGGACDVTDACETREKYRDSGIYKLFYLYAKWPDPDPDDFLDNAYKPE